VFQPAFGLVLRPEIAAMTMAGSSFLVAVNALTLKRLKLPTPTTSPAAPPQPPADPKTAALAGEPVANRTP